MPESCPPGLAESRVSGHCRAPWGRHGQQRDRRSRFQPAMAARARTEGPQRTRRWGQHGRGEQGAGEGLGGDQWLLRACGIEPRATPARPARAGRTGLYTRRESPCLPVTSPVTPCKSPGGSQGPAPTAGPAPGFLLRPAGLGALVPGGVGTRELAGCPPLGFLWRSRAWTGAAVCPTSGPRERDGGGRLGRPGAERGLLRGVAAGSGSVVPRRTWAAPGGCRPSSESLRPDRARHSHPNELPGRTSVPPTAGPLRPVAVSDDVFIRRDDPFWTWTSGRDSLLRTPLCFQAPTSFCHGD